MIFEFEARDLLNSYCDIHFGGNPLTDQEEEHAIRKIQNGIEPGIAVWETIVELAHH